MKSWLVVGLVVSAAWATPPPESKEQQALRLAKSAGTWNGITYISMDLPELEQLFWADFKSKGIPLVGRTGLWTLVVDDDSPAAKAGFEQADVIVRIGGKKIVNADDFIDWQTSAVAGESYAVHIWRITVKDEKATWIRKILHITPATAIGGSMAEMVAELPAKSTGGFRGVPWGTNKTAVQERETGMAQSENGILAYEGAVAELDAVIAYVLVDDKLVRGKYVVTVEHSNNLAYLTDYATLKTLLESKYGDPTEDQTLWLDDLYKDDPQQWGMAVASGRLILAATWSLKDTTVTLALHGDNFDIQLELEYASRQYASLEEQHKKQQALDDL